MTSNSFLMYLVMTKTSSKRFKVAIWFIPSHWPDPISFTLYSIFTRLCYQTQALGLADSYLPSLYSFSHLTLVSPKPQNLSSHFSVKSFWMVSSSPQKKYKHSAFKASWSHCSLPCGWSPLALHTLCFISCQTLRQVGWVRNGDTWDQLEK